jgi:hypothetical protein
VDNIRRGTRVGCCLIRRRRRNPSNMGGPLCYAATSIGALMTGGSRCVREGLPVAGRGGLQ